MLRQVGDGHRRTACAPTKPPLSQLGCRRLICVSPPGAKWSRGRLRSTLATSRRWAGKAVRLFCVLGASALLLLGQAGGARLISLAAAETADDAGSKSATNEPPSQEELQLPLLVDTKYWIRNMEFGEQENWRGRQKPCTLVERIVIQQEAAVISFGDSFDALGAVGLESNIRELHLAQDGVLLLEEDTLAAGPIDPMFVQYLNESGDCLDSSQLTTGPKQAATASSPLFMFEPQSNSMSWFNPANWHSELNGDGLVGQLVPDSHKIPCSEDVVVFGSRRHSFWPTVEGNERAKIVAFRVNFRPAEGSSSQAFKRLTAPLRVSKLKVEERSYSQAEFDQLTGIYGNKLFDFHDQKSVFGAVTAVQGRQDMLIIDDSSIRHQDSQEICREEAGCYCGNEQPELMDIICSFNSQPANDDASLACRDPIQVTGYCEHICATSMTIIMEPDKFKESFLTSELNRMDEGASDGYFSEHVFVGSRRVDLNRYEIVLRLVPTDDNIYEQVVGRDLEFAQRFKQRLEQAAIKSFYGIRSVEIRSSVDWRRDNRFKIMWISFVLTSVAFILIIVLDDELLSARPSKTAQNNIWRRFTGREPMTSNTSNDQDLTPDTALSDGRNPLDQDGSMSELLFAQPPDVGVELVEMDARSITDSTHDLIDSDS